MEITINLFYIVLLMALFILLFIIYIGFTEWRIYKIDKDHRFERDKLLKSVLDEADIRKAREQNQNEMKEYYDIEKVRALAQTGSMKDLPPKDMEDFYDEEEEKTTEPEWKTAIKETNDLVEKAKKMRNQK